jgi:hypothetical protein
VIAADRAERIEALAKVALGIIQRNSVGYYIDPADGGRFRVWDFRHNAILLSFRRRVDADDRPAMLVIKFEGETGLGRVVE